MEHIVRTIMGAYLQTTQLLGLPTVIKPNSTLNQKFNIHNEVLVADSDRPSVQYVCIGNGGHKMVTGTSGVSRPEPIQHTPRDTALYNHLPFVLRLPANDLLPAERVKYRLRRMENHDGTQYVAYYLRVLDLSSTIPQLEFRTVAGGVTTSTTYNPTIADLNPTPPPLTSTGVLTTTGDYVAATAKVPFIMESFDVDEFLNVCNIIYGDESYGIVSEMALCSGVDKAVVGNFNGVSSGYTDAIGVQVVSFINTFFAASFNNDGLEQNFDIGAVEPMLVLR
jgi:hypothetical protein